MWPSDICDVHNHLCSAFYSAHTALNLDELDPICLKYYLDHASQFIVSMVYTLGMWEDDPLPTDYISGLVQAVGLLVIYLKNMLNSSNLWCVKFYHIYD
jgi:hypothetical protein